MKGVKTMDEIKGISCEAKNCIHHDKANGCTAGHITVGNRTATTSTDTTCETFQCCDDCGCGCK